MAGARRPRARVKAKDEAEFRRWEKLAGKMQKRNRKATPKDDESSIRSTRASTRAVKRTG